SSRWSRAVGSRGVRARLLRAWAARRRVPALWRSRRSMGCMRPACPSWGLLAAGSGLPVGEGAGEVMAAVRHLDLERRRVLHVGPGDVEARAHAVAQVEGGDLLGLRGA